MSKTITSIEITYDSSTRPRYYSWDMCKIFNAIGQNYSFTSSNKQFCKAKLKLIFYFYKILKNCEICKKSGTFSLKMIKYENNMSDTDINDEDFKNFIEDKDETKFKCQCKMCKLSLTKLKRTLSKSKSQLNLRKQQWILLHIYQNDIKSFFDQTLFKFEYNQTKQIIEFNPLLYFYLLISIHDQKQDEIQLPMTFSKKAVKHFFSGKILYKYFKQLTSNTLSFNDTKLFFELGNESYIFLTIHKPIVFDKNHFEILSFNISDTFNNIAYKKYPKYYNIYDMKDRTISQIKDSHYDYYSHNYGNKEKGFKEQEHLKKFKSLIINLQSHCFDIVYDNILKSYYFYQLQQHYQLITEQFTKFKQNNIYFLQNIDKKPKVGGITCTCYKLFFEELDKTINLPPMFLTEIKDLLFKKISKTIVNKIIRHSYLGWWYGYPTKGLKSVSNEKKYLTNFSKEGQINFFMFSHEEINSGICSKDLVKNIFKLKKPKQIEYNKPEIKNKSKTYYSRLKLRNRTKMKKQNRIFNQKRLTLP